MGAGGQPDRSSSGAWLLERSISEAKTREDLAFAGFGESLNLGGQTVCVPTTLLPGEMSPGPDQTDVEPTARTPCPRRERARETTQDRLRDDHPALALGRCLRRCLAHRIAHRKRSAGS